MRSERTHQPCSVLSATLCLLALACRHPTSCPPCSGAFRTDAALQARIEAQWQTIAHDVGPGRALNFQCLCFGAGASTSEEGRNIYLPLDWDLREQTARAAHLAAHRNQPPWDARATAPCDARVDQALDREVDAHDLELLARRALGVVDSRYPFESQYVATPPQERRAWLRGYFVSHPHGDGVIPGFVSQYRARCQH